MITKNGAGPRHRVGDDGPREDRLAEMKVRGDGLRQLYGWRIRADQSEPLAVLPLELAAEVAALAERGRR